MIGDRRRERAPSSAASPARSALRSICAGLTLLGCSSETRPIEAEAAAVDATAALAVLGAPADGTLSLSDVGLYSDLESGRLAPDLREFTPAYPLWSDGAEKRRWLRLPPGQTIDSSAMADWEFPPGTMSFKEFSFDGRRVETRLIARTGPGPDDYWMGAFLWDADESDARFVPEGATNALGTDHDVPSARACGVCHNGARGRALGLSATQTPTLDAHLLTDAIPEPALVGAAAVARDALGYLHGNCAHCHNPRGSARPDTDMDLRLLPGEREPSDTAAARTTIQRPLQRYTAPHLSLRVVPGAPEQSALLARMNERGTADQMPPIATERVDSEGVAQVRAWIASLATPDRAVQ
jgi:hypothetical protein